MDARCSRVKAIVLIVAFSVLMLVLAYTHGGIQQGALFAAAGTPSPTAEPSITPGGSGGPPPTPSQLQFDRPTAPTDVYAATITPPSTPQTAVPYTPKP